MATDHGLYQPIGPHQTRVIRLHGSGRSRKSEIICNLYTADLLHPTLGLGIKVSGGNDYVTHFTALSYTWGGETPSVEVLCNGRSLKITPNLHAALCTLRPPGDGIVYIWADGICINQASKSDKAIQVANMFTIYQIAEQVVGWLGPVPGDVDAKMHDGFAALAALRNRGLDEGSINNRILAALIHIWQSTWFKRVWVQQEIYAARDLVLQVGDYKIKCLRLVSQPIEVSKLPFSKDEAGTMEKSAALKSLTAVTGQWSLQTFRQYSGTKDRQLDLIETVLMMSRHGVSNPIDRIYGVLGMTGYPAQSMRTNDWLAARRDRNFVPIDYHSGEVAMLCAVTWSLLMRGGLNLLAKFKVFDDADDAERGRGLPSWVIDWQRTSKLFAFTTHDEGDKVTLRNMWSFGGNGASLANHSDDVFPHNINRVRANARLTNAIRDAWEIGEDTDVPEQHRKFLSDNRHVTDLRKLRVRGVIDPRFHAKGRQVWERGRFGIPTVGWKLECDVKPTDIVVFLEASRSHYSLYPIHRSGGVDSFQPDGLWLLRPLGAGEYKLVAFLLQAQDEEVDANGKNHGFFRLSYRHWVWIGDVAQVRGASSGYRRLAVHKSRVLPFGIFQPPEEDKRTEYRTFTIV